MAVQTLTPPQGLMEMAIFSSLTFLIHEVLDDLMAIEIWVIHNLRRQGIGKEGFPNVLNFEQYCDQVPALKAFLNMPFFGL